MHLNSNILVLFQGSRGASVKEWNYRAGSCQDHSRCCHVGSGKHQCALHGNRIYIKKKQQFSQYLHKSNSLCVCHFRPQMNSMKESLLSILNRFALFQPCVLSKIWYPCCHLRHHFVICPDFEGSWNGVQDAHSLFGCGHFNNALWEINRLKDDDLWCLRCCSF